MTEITLHQTVGQLRRIADQERFVSERIGQPGCLRRREAADNVIALDAAINLLSGLAPQHARRSGSPLGEEPRVTKDPG